MKSIIDLGLTKLIDILKEDHDAADVMQMTEERARVMRAQHVLKQDFEMDMFGLGFAKESGGLSKVGRELFSKAKVVSVNRDIARHHADLRMTISISDCIESSKSSAPPSPILLHYTYRRTQAKQCDCPCGNTDTKAGSTVKSDNSTVPSGDDNETKLCDKHVSLSFDISWSRWNVSFGKPSELVSLVAVVCGYHRFPDVDVDHDAIASAEAEDDSEDEEDDEKPLPYMCAVCCDPVKYKMQLLHSSIVELTRAMYPVLPDMWAADEDSGRNSKKRKHNSVDERVILEFVMPVTMLLVSLGNSCCEDEFCVVSFVTRLMLGDDDEEEEGEEYNEDEEDGGDGEGANDNEESDDDEEESDGHSGSNIEDDEEEESNDDDDDDESE